MAYAVEDVQSRPDVPENWQKFFNDDYEVVHEKEEDKRPRSFWKKPPTKTYADNFGFGVNRYQCMIDYIDKKDRGIDVDPTDVKLPYLEERCMNKYSARKPLQFYDNDDIDAFTEKGREINTRIRQTDAATGGNPLNRTHSAWSMTKKNIQVLKNSTADKYKSDRDDALVLESGELQPKAFGSVGCQFALDSMDPLNLTLMRAHNNLDHAIYMTSRANRMDDMDNQLGGVVGHMTDGAEDLNRRAKKEMGRNRSVYLTPYDHAKSMGELSHISDDLSDRRQQQRRMEYQAIQAGVDDLAKYDRSRETIRNNLRSLDDTVNDVGDSVSAMIKKHRIERGMQDEIPVAVLSGLTKQKARKMLDLHVDEEDIYDPELAKLKMRRRHSLEHIDERQEAAFKKKYADRADTLSTVQGRVMQKARRMNGTTITSTNITDRARYVNIYTGRYGTNDKDSPFVPSRVEMNIDHMAKTLASKGRIQRKYTVEECEEAPTSDLCTFTRNLYSRGSVIKEAGVVPSISRRVRSAICVARQRNAIAGR